MTKIATGVIKINHLNHWFGMGDTRTQTLFDNNLEVERGEIVFLTGPSGSGKTTLLTLVGTLRTVQDGSLVVLGEELRGISLSASVELRKKIGFIFQSHNLFGSLTAMQNVRMAADLVGMPREESTVSIEKLLTQLGLGHRIHYKPKALSGGQKQRVAVARALIHRPQILLADEPTAALDEETGRETMNLFRELADHQGCTILMVTHDNRILDVADRIVNMVGGHITNDSHLRYIEAICQFLRSIHLFDDLTPRTLTDLASQVETRKFDAQETIVAEGDPGREFYMIADGRVAINRGQNDSLETINHLKTGDHFGEVALLNNQLRNATVISVEPTTCYVLGQEQFRQVIESSDSFASELRKAAFERI